MQWFRWNRRWGSCAALFALALQLALSFGHLHLDELGVTAVAAQISNASHPGKSPGNAPDTDELCAICAVISMSGTLVIPQAPALVFAAASHAAFFTDLAAILVANHERDNFQARAPPA
jgi:hypothetical protein